MRKSTRRNDHFEPQRRSVSRTPFKPGQAHLAFADAVRAVTAKPLSAGKKSAHKIAISLIWFKRRKVINIGVSALVIVGLLVGILLPMTTVQASETLNWSSNADFAMNKTSKCGATQTTNIAISETPYTDTSCAALGVDADGTLKTDVFRVRNVKEAIASEQSSFVLKDDGTVWGWGVNSSGQLGDGSTTNSAYPVQVKGVDGTGFLNNVKTIASYGVTSYAVKNDGTVWSWGGNGSGQLGINSKTASNTPVQVKGPAGVGFLSDVKEISASNSYVLVLKNDGTVWGWGYNSYAQLGDPYTPSEALSPYQVKAYGGSGTEPLTNVKSIATGFYHALAVKNDGTVWAWGWGAYGQLGLSYPADTAYAARQVSGLDGVGFLTDVTSVAAGIYSSTALKNDGSVWSWGNNSWGALGSGNNASTTTPHQVAGVRNEGFLTDVKAIASKYGHSLAIKNDGTVLSWGKNDDGQLGTASDDASSSIPVQVKGLNGAGYLENATAISVGYAHSLAIDQDKSVWAWGQNTYTQLGVRLQGSSTRVPNYVIESASTPALSDVKSVEMSSNATGYAIKNDGTLWSWGKNDYGQLGDGTTTDNPKVRQVRAASGNGYLTDVKSVRANSFGAIVLKNDGTVWAWGDNSNYQLGDGTTTSAKRPIQVKGLDGNGFLDNVVDVTMSSSVALAVKSDGTVWAWGYNGNSQLGSQSSGYTPAQVRNSDNTGFLTDVKSVVAGAYSVTAVKNDGTAWAWGYNIYGQVGSDNSNNFTYPTQVENSDGTGFLTGVASVALDDTTTYAVKTDGTAWAWGYNGYGNLGTGVSTYSVSLPQQIKNSDGSGFLTGVSSISSKSLYALATKTDGSVWGWGRNSYRIGDGYYADQSLPVQVVGKDNVGKLTNVRAAVAGSSSIAVKNDGEVLVWGGPSNGSMGYDAKAGIATTSIYPRTMLADFKADNGFSTTGTMIGFIVDAGLAKKRQWNDIQWTSAALPSNTKISFAARTSNDGTTWSAWTSDAAQATAGSTEGSADISALPLSRFIEIKATLNSLNQVATPTLHDFALVYVQDDTPPSTNASEVQMRKTSAGTSIEEAAWTNASSPYFSWTPGADNQNGLGLLGYCLYLGQDASADIQQTKGMLGASPVSTEGACQYMVSGTSLNTAVQTLATQFTTSDQPYYLLVKAVDKAGNIYDGDAESFSFRFDNTPPTTPAFISAPSQFISTKEATMTWPTTGATAASDSNSGLAGLQYKVGANGTWYGDDHTGTQDITDVLANDGTYTTDPTRDYPLLNEGNNIIYFRTIDNAGNVSTTNNTAAVKINTTSPTPPQNLTATPATNTANAFSFDWSPPSSFVGPANALTYCYTVNTLPTANTCTFTPAGQSNLATDAYATQPGENILYVVAKDEAGNVNYDTYASTTFSANTPAPGIPVGTEIADISTKATQTWKLALSWAAPTNVGAGVSKYAVYRSTNGVTFSQIATTSGLSYVDSSLAQEMYYYKIRACDSANNCGAFSDVFSRTPTGRFTSPPELLTSPSVQVSTKKASFTYVTDRVSDSRIQYGTKSGEYFPGEVAVSASTKNHKVEISNLDAGTTYFYKAKWTDEDGNTGTSTELSFTTLPAPSIKNVSVIKTTLTSATIQFTATDASKVNIYYGKTEGFGGLETINTSRSESTYTVELNGLDDGATYFYKFSTFDSDENEYDSRRADSFTTPPRPRISDLRFQPVAGEPTSTQKVTWKTNVPANSTVSYGKVGETSRDVYDARPTTDHEMTVNNLDDASEYSLLAQSRDTSGNLAISDRQTFRTALDTRAPKISDIQIESLVKGNGTEARGQIVVSWKTDEPATSQIGYAQGSNGKNYTNQTAEDTRLSTEHVVIVSDLSVSSVYHLQPISRDRSSNTAKGDDKSAIIGRATDSVLNIILSTLNKIFGL